MPLRRPDRRRHARGRGQLEAGDDRGARLRPQPHRARCDAHEAERVVQPERALDRGGAALVVLGGDDPAPAPERVGLAFPRGRGPGVRVDAGLPRGGLVQHRRPARPDQARRHGRRRDHLERELLALGDPVTVRRDDRERGRRRVDAGVEDRQRLGDRALAAGVRGPVHQPAVEGHRRRAARVERGGSHRAEPDHRLRELPVRHSDAEAAAAPVDGEQDDLPVGALADRGARVARAELRRQEVLAGRPDRLAAAHDHGPAAERVGDAASRASRAGGSAASGSACPASPRPGASRPASRARAAPRRSSGSPGRRPSASKVTTPVRSVPGTAGGNGCSTTSNTPGILGVVAPQAGVKSEVPSPRGGWFRPVSGRRWPRPCQ